MLIKGFQNIFAFFCHTHFNCMKFLTVLRCLGTVLMKDINYFTVGDKAKSSQQARRQSVSSVTLHWPLEGYEFCLACKLCFIKQGEGVGGMYSVTSHKP